MATILLVDDDDAICRIVALHLGRCGHTVLRASDGTAAFAIAARQSADLALIDQLLPGVPGRVVIQQLRADPRWRDVPLVAMSGTGQAYVAAHAPRPSP